MELRAAILFQKRKVKYKFKEIVALQYLDLVVGISFVNTDNQKIFQILTGDYQGEHIYLNSTKNKSNIEVLIIDLEMLSEMNDNKVNWSEFQNITKIFTKSFYRLKGNDLQKIDDEKLIRKLQEEYPENIEQELPQENESQVDKYIRDIKNDIEEIVKLKYDGYEDDIKTLYNLANNFIIVRKNSSESERNFLYNHPYWIRALVNIELKIKYYQNISYSNYENNRNALAETIELLRKQNIDTSFADESKNTL